MEFAKIARDEADHACEAARIAASTSEVAEENFESMNENNMEAIVDSYHEEKTVEEVAPDSDHPTPMPLGAWSKDSARALHEKWKVKYLAHKTSTLSTLTKCSNLYSAGVGSILLHWDVNSLQKSEGGEIQLSAPLFNCALPV